VVRDPARRAGVRPLVGEVRVAEVEVASIPITPISFGNARTTAGARLCSPPMTIGIFPARTTSAAMCVTPSTISVDAQRSAYHPIATATSRRSRWCPSCRSRSCTTPRDRTRSEAGAAAERAGAVVRHSKQAIHASSYFATASAKRGAAMGETEIACAYLRTTPLNWTRACAGRALRRT